MFISPRSNLYVFPDGSRAVFVQLQSLQPVYNGDASFCMRSNPLQQHCDRIAQMPFSSQTHTTGLRLIIGPCGLLGFWVNQHACAQVRRTPLQLHWEGLPPNEQSSLLSMYVGIAQPLHCIRTTCWFGYWAWLLHCESPCEILLGSVISLVLCPQNNVLLYRLPCTYTYVGTYVLSAVVFVPSLWQFHAIGQLM